MENSFIILIFNIVLTATLILMQKYCLKKDNLASKAYKKVYRVVVYNLMIRFVIESYLEFTLITLLSYRRIRFKYTTDVISSALTYVFMIVLFCMPLIFFFFSIKFYPRYKEAKFRDKFGSLFSEINLKKPYSKFN
jgi:TRAP-type C4-dicarboxylate transport system permease small subunit